MKSLFVFAVLVVPTMAWADLTIFDVRKNLPMSDQEKVYRDFYINGGTESGIQPGMLITVQRRLPLYNSYQNRSAGDLELKVARVKIIHSQKGLSVARLHTEFTREGAPLLEDNFIMVGDRLDIGSATSEKDGKKAENESAPTPVAANRSAPQIVVNSVELASPLPRADEIPTPNAVDNPIMQ
ncbi:MAG TPA: hypothetical protein PKC28_03670 [Bdellovibrionales bacterium]|nr:hypothetical protein [Bdellovibrionales bacterium]